MPLTKFRQRHFLIRGGFLYPGTFRYIRNSHRKAEGQSICAGVPGKDKAVFVVFCLDSIANATERTGLTAGIDKKLHTAPLCSVE